MTEPPPITRIPHSGHPDLPAREDRDWVLSTELIDEAGITYRQLDYWTRTGLLTPIRDVDIAPGSGHVRRYDADQVQRAVLVKSLLAAGMTLQRGIRDVVDEIASTGRLELGDITLTVHHPGDAA